MAGNSDENVEIHYDFALSLILQACYDNLLLLFSLA